MAATDPSASASPATSPDFTTALLQNAASAFQSTVDAVNGAVGPYTDALKGIGGQAMGMAGMASGAAGTTASAANSEAQGQILIAKAQAVAASARQQTAAYNASILGETPGAPSDAVLNMISEITNSTTEALNQSKKIQALQDTSFWDDPLKWITNQVAIPFEQDTLTTMQNRATTAAKGLQELGAQFDQEQRINDTVNVANADQVLAGQTKQFLAEAQLKAAQAQMEASRVGLGAINVMAATTKDAFNANIDAARLQTSVIGAYTELHRAQLEDENAPLRQATMQAKIDEITDLITNRNQTAEAQQKFLGMANMAMKNLGGGDNAIPNVKAYEMLPAPVKSVLESAMYAPDASDGRIAATPSAALDVLNKASTVLQLPQGMQITQKMFNDTVNPSIAAYNKQYGNIRPFEALKPVEQQAVIQDGLDKFIAAQKAQVPATGGLFSPPTLSGTVKIFSGTDDANVKQILVPLSIAAKADPTLPTDPSLIMATGMRLVQSGTMSPQDFAAAASKIYQGSIVQMNQLKMFTRMAVAPISPDKLPMSLPMPGSRGTLVNMGDPTAITNYITKMIAYNNSAANAATLNSSANQTGMFIPQAPDPLANAQSILSKNGVK